MRLHTLGRCARPLSLLLATTAIALSTAPLAASAADPAPAAVSPSDLPTESIIVSASRGTKLEDMDVSTTVLSHDTIVHAPEESIDQILNKVPGVVISMVPSNQVHPTGKSIQMRGFGGTGERVLVMVDGIPVNDPYYRYVNWDKIPKDSVERIEVIRGGGATTLWGNLAMGGIVNIVTRAPKPGEARLSVGYGSDNTFRSNAGATLYASPLFTVAANVARAQGDGYNLTPAQYRNSHLVATSSYSDDGELAAYLTPDDKSRYYLKAAIHDMHEYHLVWDNAKNAQGSYEFKAGGKTDLADGSNLDVNGWFGRYEMKTQNTSTNPAYSYRNASNPAVTDYISTLDHNPYYDYGGSAAWKKELKGPISEIMVGTDTRNIFGKDDSKAYSAAGVLTAETLTHGQQQSNGVFVQGTYRPEGIPLDVTLGLREDFWRAFGAETNGLAQHAYGNYSHFDPRLGAKYYLTDNLAARGAVYENYAAPGMNQLFRSYGNSSSYSLANGSLVPETNLGQEFGLEYKTSGASLSGTVFHNDVSNIIDKAKICTNTGTLANCSAIPLPNIAMSTTGSIQKNFNAGDAVTEGWELDGEWKATPTVTLNSSLTRTIAFLTSNQTMARTLGQGTANSYEPLGGQLGGVPPLLFTSGATWQALEHLRLTTQLRAWNKTPDDTQHTTFDSGAAVIDVGATYDIAENIQVFGSATNLFNHFYYATGLSSTSTGTPPTQGAPLTVFGGVRMTY
jgi:outer membrane receptor protein involved in Fe transport